MSDTYTVWYRTVRRDEVRCLISLWKRVRKAEDLASIEAALKAEERVVSADCDCETVVMTNRANPNH